MQELKKFTLPDNFRGRSALFVQLWWFIDIFLFRFTPQYFYPWRRFVLRLFGAKIGKGVIIRPSVSITYPWKVEIGDYSWIGDDVELYSLGKIKIGNNVVISQKCYLCTGSHDYRKSNFAIFEKPIIIEDESWLATDVFVAPGVRVGRGAVVGARSSVFKDLESKAIYFGNPAKKVSER